MAELNKTVLGKVRGSIGDLTFRQRNGKNVIAMKPSSFTPGSDPASIARRSRFKLTVNLAAGLNNVPFIRSLWNSVKPAEMTAFNFIFKSNYKFVSSDNIISNPLILPGYGFNVDNPTGTYNSDSVDITFEALGDSKGIDTSVETNAFLVNLLFLSEPLNSNFDKNQISIFESEMISLDLENALTFNVAIPNSLSAFYNDYQEKKIYSVLITVDSSKNIINYSNSFSV